VIVLRELPIESLPEYTYGHGSIDVVNDYSKYPRETQPPIIVDGNNDVVDGQRRLGASRKRGDVTITAWIEVSVT